MTELVRYDEMRRAIDAAYEVDEVKDIRDKARAMEAYFRMAQDPEPERQACEIRLRSERRAGQLLKAMEKAKGRAGAGRPPLGGHSIGPPKSEAKTLAEHGITKNQSAKWQALAEVPEEEFEAALAAPDKPTTNGIIAKVKPAKPCNPQTLWLWGRLNDFERDGLLNRTRADLFDSLTDGMREDIERLAPLVARWLLKEFGDDG